MDLKYWQEDNVRENGGWNRNTNGLVLKDESGSNAYIVSFAKLPDDTIMVSEECDGYYSINYTKEQFLEMIEELKQYILKD